METSFQKIKKRTYHYIPIAHWSYKAYSVFYTETGTRTTVFDMSNTLHRVPIECSNRMLRIRFHQTAIFYGEYLSDLFENVKMDDTLSLLRETELFQKYD